MKRALSLILAIAMILSMAVTAFAAEAGTYEVNYDVQLKMGKNTLSPLPNVETTVYEFSPTEAGHYIFTVDDPNAKVGYWGGGSFFVSDQTENKTNTLEFTLNSTGPSIMVGVSGVEGEFVLTVSTGEYEAPPVVENVMYENKHTPVPYTLPDYYLRSVNVTDGKPQEAVLDSEGYYHLDSIDGPVLVIDLTHDLFNIDAALGTGNVASYEKNEMGQTIRKIDYRDAVKAYLAASDGGCYPLTEDLAQVYQKYGEGSGWYSENNFIFKGVVPDEDGWLFACSYNKEYTSVSGNIPVEPDPSEPTEPTEPETEPTEPEAGSAENPIMLNSMKNTVTAKGTTYFQGYFSGMEMTVSGTGSFSVIYNGQTIAAQNSKVELYVASDSPRMPISFAIVGNGQYSVNFEYPLGTAENPEPLALGSAEVPYEKGSQGHFLTWTAEEDGIFTLEIYSENWTYVINNITAYKYGDNHASNDNEVVSSESVEVKAGDVLEIVIGSADYESADVSIYTMFTTAPGTEGNPIFFEDENYDTENLEDTISVPAGATQYFTGRVGGMIMTLKGKDVVVSYNGKEYAPVDGVITIEVEAGGFMAPPAVFQITNKAASAATYSVEFSYPAGTMNNPAQLVLDANVAQIAENSQGYFYTWIAEADGTLTIEMTCDKWTYVINNMTAFAYGDNHSSDDEEVISSETVEVKAGDQIDIVVGTPDWSAAEVSFYAMFVTEAGTEGNPIFFEDENYDTVNLEDTITIPAGESKYYTGRVGGMIMTLKGKDVVVSYNGKEYTPVDGVITIEVEAGGFMAPPAVFQITNKAASAASYSVVFSYPAGTMNNPAQLVLDTNVAQIAENSQGYFYTWIAEADGTLTIEMTCDKWTYVINNMTAFAYGDNHSSDDEEVISSETVEVKAGDQIDIVVGTPDWSAAEVSFYAMFVTEAGTEGNPIFFEDENYDTENLEDTISVPAGAAQYFTGRVGGMIMTLKGKDVVVSYNGKEYTPVDGVITIEIEDAGFMAPPAVFQITNKAASAATYSVEFSYPAGTMNNPAQLVLDTNVAQIAENSQGYFYTWIAEADGTLTIEMTCDKWTYVINNMTAFAYGDNHSSDDEEVISSETVEVKAGDQIDIVVGTPDWSAAEVSFYAMFVEAAGSENNPIWFEDENYDTSAVEDTLKIPAGATKYYTGRVGGMIMTLKGKDVVVSYNGKAYTPVNGVITIDVEDAGMFGSYIFAITNNAAAEASYAVTFNYPAGSMGNPAELALGSNTASVGENSQGYFYTWTAEQDGVLTITMNSKDWTYSITNMTSYVYGESHSSDADTVVASESVEVKAGDEIQIVLGTPDWTAGQINFTAEFSTISKLNFRGVNMTLGNALDINFFINKADIEGEGNYAVITKHYANGDADAVVTVTQDQWTSLANMYFFTFTGVKAKEMGDKFEAVIYNAEGEAISEVYEDSVQAYSRRMLDKAETQDKDKSLYVEMLNYGAAAQVKFSYDVENPVNSVITAEEQKTYGISARTYENQSETTAGYIGASLTLESRILFNVVFDASYVTEGSYAVATFVNHNGKKMEDTVTEFAPLGKYMYASFTNMSVADRSQLITITLYDANDNAVVTVKDSVEGYVARMPASDPLYVAIMKFADAAYKYFH